MIVYCGGRKVSDDKKFDPMRFGIFCKGAYRWKPKRRAWVGAPDMGGGAPKHR